MARKSYQQGSVKKRSYQYGTAYILYYRERQTDGTWRQRTKTLRQCDGYTQKKAQKELDSILDKINQRNGARVECISTRLSDLTERIWLDYLDNQQLKPSTRYGYESMLKNWILPAFGKMLLNEIHPVHVGQFMADLSSNELSPRYRKNIYSLLKLLFDVAVENELLELSPIKAKIHRPKCDDDEKPVWTLDHARAVLEAVEAAWKAPVFTLAFTGLRAGELLALRWQNLDFVRKRIKVTHSLWRHQLLKPKTKKSLRTLVMPDPLVQVLLDHRRESDFTDPDDFVFCQADGRPMDSDSLRRTGIYPAVKRAGVPYWKRATGCHAFRHLVGTIIHRTTGSLKLAQTQLGHSKVSTTGDIYTHVDEQELEKSSNALDQALSKAVVEMLYKTENSTETVQ